MPVEMNPYIPLSAVMFLEYAIWGAWAPVLAARLLGPLKMTGKQTGWIYATLPLSCIVAPLISGQVADQWINTEWILASCHLIGAVVLFIAASRRTFVSLLVAMFCYSFCYAATLPLVNAVVFEHAADAGGVFLWAPVAWALVGILLTGWRWVFKTGAEGRDCLYFAAVLSVAMGASCFFLPTTVPEQTGKFPILEALSMLGNSNFLIFILISMVVAGLMQFYFLGTARFMQDLNIPAKNVPASMGIAQIAQAVATYYALIYLIDTIGYQWTLTLGAASWVVMYAVYVVGKPPWLIIISQSFHGMAYVFFMIAGQFFVNWFAESIGKEEIRSSMQALVFAATVGVGLFVGTHAAGFFMDLYCLDGKFNWRKIWMVPGVVMLAGAIALAVLFQTQ